MRHVISLVVHAVAGWAICGATVAIGRQIVSLHATLLVHAAVAPLAFAALTWHYVHRFPASSPGRTAVTMTVVVVALDAGVVAPFLQRNYTMFTSVLGTWLPFASIAAASYAVARTVGSRRVRTPDHEMTRR